MCGIAGLLSRDCVRPDVSLLERMCDRLKHRGPDSYGYFAEAPVALGHRRLSIIDLSTGDQPMGNEDGWIQVIFNGEIYNYRELREDLIEKGHQFRTGSDTEVLVHLYEETGERMPELLNGMFAFALWDSRRESLLLVRDRLGKKPLYYTQTIPGFALCFASELKALAVLPGFDQRVNRRAVADFLSLSYIPDPDTIYETSAKLPPASAVIATRSGVRVWRYWKPRVEPQLGFGLEEATGEIRRLGCDAVGRRLLSDVPLGAFLSGGVDSSAVVGLMTEQSAEPVKTFSIGFTNKDFDELEYARMAAKLHRTEHHEEVVSPRVEDIFETLVDQFDEPFADSSAIPMLYLSRMTRRHVTVALCGDGADEIFGGYRRYFFGVLEHKLREKFPRWFRKSVVRAGGEYYPKFDYLPRVFRAKTMLLNVADELGDAYFTSMTAFRDRGLEDVLSPELRVELNHYSPREKFRNLFRAVHEHAPLEQMQLVDLETYLPGDILVKADRATMAFSLESRSPWLDYRLAELAFRLPSGFKVNGRTGKYVFKRAMASYVPEAVIRRSKMGFSVPLAEWFRTSLKPLFQSLVMAEEMNEFVCPSMVKKIWEEHQSRRHNHDRKLWNLLMLAAWNQRHRGSGTAELNAERLWEAA
jgi:asparagine synthase (glutamine-hydrolysing)